MRILEEGRVVGCSMNIYSTDLISSICQVYRRPSYFTPSHVTDCMTAPDGINMRYKSHSFCSLSYWVNLLYPARVALYNVNEGHKPQQRARYIDNLKYLTLTVDKNGLPRLNVYRLSGVLPDVSSQACIDSHPPQAGLRWGRSVRHIEHDYVGKSSASISID